MKSSKIVMSCMLFLSVLTVHAKQISVNEVKTIQEEAQSGAFAGRAEWNALTYYLQGVIEGAAGYQESFGKVEKRLLFCPPKDKRHSI